MNDVSKDAAQKVVDEITKGTPRFATWMFHLTEYDLWFVSNLSMDSRGEGGCEQFVCGGWCSGHPDCIGRVWWNHNLDQQCWDSQVRIVSCCSLAESLTSFRLFRDKRYCTRCSPTELVFTCMNELLASRTCPTKNGTLCNSCISKARLHVQKPLGLISANKSLAVS